MRRTSYTAVFILMVLFGWHGHANAQELTYTAGFQPIPFLPLEITLNNRGEIGLSLNGHWGPFSFTASASTNSRIIASPTPVNTNAGGSLTIIQGGQRYFYKMGSSIPSIIFGTGVGGRISGRSNDLTIEVWKDPSFHNQRTYINRLEKHAASDDAEIHTLKHLLAQAQNKILQLQAKVDQLQDLRHLGESVVRDYRGQIDRRNVELKRTKEDLVLSQQTVKELQDKLAATEQRNYHSSSLRQTLSGGATPLDNSTDNQAPERGYRNLNDSQYLRRTREDSYRGNQGRDEDRGTYRIH